MQSGIVQVAIVVGFVVAVVGDIATVDVAGGRVVALTAVTADVKTEVDASCVDIIVAGEAVVDITVDCPTVVSAIVVCCRVVNATVVGPTTVGETD